MACTIASLACIQWVDRPLTLLLEPLRDTTAAYWANRVLDGFALAVAFAFFPHWMWPVARRGKAPRRLDRHSADLLLERRPRSRSRGAVQEDLRTQQGDQLEPASRAPFRLHRRRDDWPSHSDHHPPGIAP